MTTATVTSKGQITIPLDVRQRLGIDVGDRIEFVELAEGEFAIKPAVQDVRSLKGMLRKPPTPVSTESMRKAIRQRGSGK
jgi:AbrB family looped-hinge helix DNA binding protein